LIFDRQRQNAGASAGIVDAALRDRQGLIEQGLIAITRGNFPDSLFGFHRPQATRPLPYRASAKTTGAADVGCGLPSRIAPIDRIGTL
jgi:hypothetical protein